MSESETEEEGQRYGSLIQPSSPAYQLLTPFTSKESLVVSVRCPEHGVKRETYPYPEDIDAWLQIIERMERSIHFASGCDEECTLTWWKETGGIRTV